MFPPIPEEIFQMELLDLYVVLSELLNSSHTPWNEPVDSSYMFSS